MNQYIAQRLRPFVNHYQDNWSDLLPMVDFAQGVLEQSSIGLTPFEVEGIEVIFKAQKRLLQCPAIRATALT